MVEEHVRRTQGYLRSYDIVRAVITLVVFVLGYLMALAVVDNWLWPGGLGRGGRTLAWLALMGLVGVYFWRAIWPHLFRQINPVYAADRLEHAQPSLMNSLVNFLLLREDERHVPAAVMQGLERQAAAGIAHLPAEAAVDRRPVLRVAYVLVGLISIAALFVVLSPKSPLTAAARILFPWADIAPATRVRIDSVDPGSKDVFRGEPVTVTATIRGLSEDDTVTLRYASVDGQSVNQSVAMVRPEGEAVYRCQLPPAAAGMQRDLVYQVEAGDAKSKDFVLHVVPAPTIQIENVEYRYPGYTRMDPLVVERLGDVKALEGTQVVIRARASQPIGTASLVLSGSRDTTLGMQTKDLAARGELLLKLVRRDGGLAPEYEGYKLVVTNERGESNPQPPTYRIEVIPDLPPQVDVYEPKQRDVKLPADQELSIDVRARDVDFALADVRLTATRNGQRLLDQSLVKGQNLRLDQPVRPSFRFAPARLGLQPGDEVLFRVTAIDNKLPQPNRQQTPEYRIEIVGPSDEQLAQNDPRQKQGEKGEQGEQGGTSAKGQEGAKGEQGGAGDKRQEGAKGEQGGQGEKGDGQKDKSEKGDGAQSGGAPGNQDQGGDKSQSGEGGKSGQEPNDDAPRDPLDDGQAVQEIVKHLEQQGKKPQDQPTQQDGNSEPGEDQVASAKAKQEQQEEQEQQEKQEQGEQSDGQSGKNSGQQNQPQPGQKQQQDSKQDSSQQQSGGNQQGDQNGGSQKDGQKQEDQKKNGLKPQPEQQQGGAQQGGGGSSEQQDGKQEGAQGNSGQGGASGNQQGSSAGDSKTAEGMSGSKQNPSQQGNSNPSGAGDKKGEQAGPSGNNQGSKSGADQGGMKQPGERAGEANAQNQPGQSQQDQQASAGEENQQGTGSQPSQKKDSSAAGSQQKPGHDPQPGTQQQSGEKSSVAPKQSPGTKADGAQKAGDQVASNEPRQNQSGEKSTDAKPGNSELPDQKAGEKSDGTKPPGLKPGERDPQTPPEKQPDAGSGGKPQAGGQQGRQQKDGNSSDGNRPKDEAKDLTQKSGESSDNRSSGKSSDKPQDKTRAPGKTPSKGEQAPSDSQSNDEDSRNPEKQRPSDTGSDQSGERAGKGPEGMGQQSSGAGGGSAGKNQAADDGGSRSPQSGPGDQGSKAGNQQQTDKKTGQAGTKPGDSRQGRPEDSQQASSENRQGDKTEPSEPNPDAQQGNHPGEGQPTGGESSQPSSGSGGDPGASGRSGPSNTKPTGDVVAGSDQLNLDYAKKATDLTLEYLQDQLAKGKVDDGLRKRLGWSEEEFQSLLKRMQAMRDRGADAQARPEDKLAYEQWLKSLGLRPASGAIRTGRPETKALDQARDDAQISVPRDLREQHEAFRRGLLEKVP